jgi:Helix-turn-helix domain
MDERPSPPPEGQLLATALAATGMSIREASRRAGISYGRWRQITTGYQNVSPGSYARVRAPAKTLARMARVVGVSPAQLDDAAREHDRDQDRQRVRDAAEILRRPQAALPELVPSRDSHPAPDGLGVQSVLDDPGLTDDEKAGAIALIMRLRERKSGVPPDPRDLTDAELRGELEDLTQRIKELHSQNRLRLGGKANGDAEQQRRA